MNQVIFITGASSGMGKDTALRLIQEGHIVYGAARRVVGQTHQNIRPDNQRLE